MVYSSDLSQEELGYSYLLLVGGKLLATILYSLKSWLFDPCSLENKSRKLEELLKCSELLFLGRDKLWSESFRTSLLNKKIIRQQ